MCFSISLSTSSTSDLGVYNTPLIRFSRGFDDTVGPLLEYAYPWTVASREQCGCGFRHAPVGEVGFRFPESWAEENELDIEATKRFESVVRDLIAEGSNVDCVNRWGSVSAMDIVSLTVELTKLPEGYFRFLENYRFEFR
jgi:hypothetical protein